MPPWQVAHVRPRSFASGRVNVHTLVSNLSMGSTVSRDRVDPMLCNNSSLRALDSKYSSMASQLLATGFDSAALARASQLFAREPPTPRQYGDPPWSLPVHAIRVLALPLSDEVLNDAPTRRIASLVLHAARDVAAALPPGSRSWLPLHASGLHATLFHPGLSPQFDTQGRLCDLPLPVPPAGCWQRTGLGAGSPSDTELSHEFRTVRRLAASVPSSLSFDVERLILSSSGVLLLLLRPRLPASALAAPATSAEGPGRRHEALLCTEAFRAAAARAFPRAARKQTSGLVHVSLLRVLSLPPAALLGPNASKLVRAVQTKLDRWNARLHGMGLTVCH